MDYYCIACKTIFSRRCSTITHIDYDRKPVEDAVISITQNIKKSVKIVEHQISEHCKTSGRV